MKIVGLITEYNPFHNGHKYHMDQARKLAGADAVIVIMSGDFVQRGAPALVPKHLRAAMALQAGADVVIELPVWCACGSAEYFAAGGVSVLDRLGCVDALCFGSECGDLALLKETAAVLDEEPYAFRQTLQSELKKGRSFPAARQTALSACLGHRDLLPVLQEPNNILAAEYIKALRRRHSSMELYTVRRQGDSYHQSTLSSSFGSASAIRKVIEEKGPDPALLGPHMPPESLRILQDFYQIRYPVLADDFSLLLKYSLMKETRTSLAEYADVTPDLAGRIENLLSDYLSFSQFCRILKTKDMTYTRISRALLHILLSITKKDLELFQQEDGCGYARILGFRKDSSQVLGHMKKHSSIPMLTRTARARELSGTAAKMLQSDLFAAGIYESAVTEKFQHPFLHEYRQQVVII